MHFTKRKSPTNGRFSRLTRNLLESWRWIRSKLWIIANNNWILWIFRNYYATWARTCSQEVQIILFLLIRATCFRKKIRTCTTIRRLCTCTNRISRNHCTKDIKLLIRSVRIINWIPTIYSIQTTIGEYACINILNTWSYFNITSDNDDCTWLSISKSHYIC